MKILVTGGVRSGKSAHAEGLMAAYDDVTYVAAGPVPSVDDAAWAARVAAHVARRPASWTTVESTDLGTAIRPATPTLVDCLGTWLTAQLDELGAWDDPSVLDALELRTDAAITAITAAEDLVLVTNEVGLGVVPAHASGRLFADLLGTLNQRVGAVVDEVHLVVAGRVLRL
ncbi:MAG: bifunctional adenosylcobinamide kinase/adenosylcobinamide-phosphate guanylyltransferase [Marmoricola sp.]